MKGEMRYLLLTLPEVNKREKMKGKGGLDYRWLYPSEVRYIMSPTSKSLQEHQEDSKKIEVNPSIKPGDKIKVIDVDEDSDERREFMNKMDIITSERVPKLYHTYLVMDEEEDMGSSGWGDRVGSPRYRWKGGYEDSHMEIEEGVQILWLLRDEDADLHFTDWGDFKVIAPHLDRWVKVEDTRTLQEHTKDKLNPKLRVGDEIIVVDVNKDYSGRVPGGKDDGGLGMTS